MHTACIFVQSNAHGLYILVHSNAQPVFLYIWSYILHMAQEGENLEMIQKGTQTYK